MDFASLAARMDAQVDARLGDSISYRRPTDPQPVDMKAFLIFGEPGDGGWTGRDQAKGIVRMKISRALVPDPSKHDRITSPLLDGTYRPLGGDPVVEGRYWLVDLQKA